MISIEVLILLVLVLFLVTCAALFLIYMCCYILVGAPFWWGPLGCSPVSPPLNPALDIYPIESDEEVEGDFLDAILQQPEAYNWSAEDYGESPWYEVNVPKSTAEYKELVARFRETCQFPISRVRRLQNPFMLGEFLLKREEMAKKGPVKTMKLFHGTTKDSLEGIFEDNFDWGRHGEHKGTRFGEGVNFTPRAGFATNFGDKRGTRVMILAYVLVGKTCIGYQDMPLPDQGTDTAMKPDGDVIVKFEENEFYPAYVFYYYPKKV